MNWVHRNRVVCWTGWSTRQRDRDRRPFMCTSLRLDTRARSEAITGIKPSPGEDESLRCPIRSCTPYKPFKMPLNPKLQCLAKEQEPPITWPSKLSLSLSRLTVGTRTPMMAMCIFRFWGRHAQNMVSPDSGFPLWFVLIPPPETGDSPAIQGPVSQPVFNFNKKLQRATMPSNTFLPHLKTFFKLPPNCCDSPLTSFLPPTATPSWPKPTRPG